MEADFAGRTKPKFLFSKSKPLVLTGFSPLETLLLAGDDRWKKVLTLEPKDRRIFMSDLDSLWIETQEPMIKISWNSMLQSPQTQTRHREDTYAFRFFYK